MDAVQVQCIQQCDDLFREQLDGIRARRQRRLSVASHVIAQDAELPSKLAGLRVPHGIICAERIRERQHGSAGRTFELVMDAGFSGLHGGHRAYSSLARNFVAAHPRPGNGNAGLTKSWCCYMRSRIRAIPWPTPMHMVQSAYLPFVRKSW